jgi:hypothetical protein
VGSNPVELTGFFNLSNPSSHSMAKPLIKIITRNLRGDKVMPARKANNLTTICVLIG